MPVLLRSTQVAADPKTVDDDVRGRARTYFASSTDDPREFDRIQPHEGVVEAHASADRVHQAGVLQGRVHPHGRVGVNPGGPYLRGSWRRSSPGRGTGVSRRGARPCRPCRPAHGSRNGRRGPCHPPAGPPGSISSSRVLTDLPRGKDPAPARIGSHLRVSVPSHAPAPQTNMA